MIELVTLHNYTITLLMDSKISLVTSQVKMSHHQAVCPLSLSHVSYPDFTLHFFIPRQSLDRWMFSYIVIILAL